MNKLAVINQNDPPTLESRVVAEMVGKRHDHLIRDIKGYCEVLAKSTAPQFGVSDFFIKNIYKDSTGRTLPCYRITKKGCEMIANKLSGKKGVLFTDQAVSKCVSGERLVNAREMHEFLGSKRQFGNWIKQRIEKYGFAEGVDYIHISQICETRTGATVRQEYYLTIDTAKEIAMVENKFPIFAKKLPTIVLW